MDGDIDMLFTLERDLNEYGGRKTMSIAWGLGYIDRYDTTTISRVWSI
jgi:hypothetical protein